jgi:hypothetical protein
MRPARLFADDTPLPKQLDRIDCEIASAAQETDALVYGLSAMTDEKLKMIEGCV